MTKRKVVEKVWELELHKDKGKRKYNWFLTHEDGSNVWRLGFKSRKQAHADFLRFAKKALRPGSWRIIK